MFLFFDYVFGVEREEFWMGCFIEVWIFESYLDVELNEFGVLVEEVKEVGD